VGHELRVWLDPTCPEGVGFKWALADGVVRRARTGPGGSGLWVEHVSRTVWREDGTAVLEWVQVEGTCDWTCAGLQPASARAKFRRWLLS
jgi:hypothetical protein